MTTVDKWTARDMSEALYRHFSGKWAVLPEVTARPVYSTPEPVTDGGLFPRYHQNMVQKARRIDLLLLRTAAVDGGIERLAVEIKVTRADFFSDVRNPEKQAPWRALAHRHTYAVPEGLVDVADVPAASGLITFRRSDGYTYGQWIRLAKRPAGHNPGPLPLPHLMDAFWRAGRAEARLRGYSGEREARTDDVTALRAQVAKLTHDLELANNRLCREQDRADRWKVAFGAVGRPPCGTCGNLLYVSRKQGGYGVDWEHRDPTTADLCHLLRRAAAEREAAELKDSLGLSSDPRYLHVLAPQPAELDTHEEESS